MNSNLFTYFGPKSEHNMLISFTRYNSYTTEIKVMALANMTFL